MMRKHNGICQTGNTGSYQRGNVAVPESLAWRNVTCLVSDKKGRWVFCRCDDGTWSFPSGERKEAEESQACAERILREQTGLCGTGWCTVAIYPIGEDGDPGALTETEGYDPAKRTAEGWGMLLMGWVSVEGKCQDGDRVRWLTHLPSSQDEEAANSKRRMFREACFQWGQDFRNRHSLKDGEEWDIWDATGRPLGYTKKRRDRLCQGEYHLVVQVWICDGEGRYLITQRAPCKGYPLFWETAGGAAVSGDDSRTAAIREAQEETGLCLRPEDGRWICRIQKDSEFCDIWVFLCRESMDRVRLEPEETVDARLVTAREVLALIAEGKFVPCSYATDAFFRQCDSICCEISEMVDVPVATKP